MEELRAYLKSLSTPEKEAFAVACGTTIGYLFKAIAVGSKLGPELSVSIEFQSGGIVTRKHLHPDAWAKQWPELAEKAAA